MANWTAFTFEQSDKIWDKLDKVALFKPYQKKDKVISLILPSIEFDTSKFFDDNYSEELYISLFERLVTHYYKLIEEDKVNNKHIKAIKDNPTRLTISPKEEIIQNSLTTIKYILENTNNITNKFASTEILSKNILEIITPSFAQALHRDPNQKRIIKQICAEFIEEKLNINNAKDITPKYIAKFAHALTCLNEINENNLELVKVNHDLQLETNFSGTWVEKAEKAKQDSIAMADSIAAAQADSISNAASMAADSVATDSTAVDSTK